MSIRAFQYSVPSNRVGKLPLLPNTMILIGGDYPASHHGLLESEYGRPVSNEVENSHLPIAKIASLSLVKWL